MQAEMMDGKVAGRYGIEGVSVRDHQEGVAWVFTRQFACVLANALFVIAGFIVIAAAIAGIAYGHAGDPWAYMAASGTIPLLVLIVWGWVRFLEWSRPYLDVFPERGGRAR